MISYEDLVTDIIQKEKAVIGPVAITKAKEIPGLYIDSEGKVTEIDEDGEEMLGKVVKKYESMVGKSISVALEKEKEKSDDELPELPEEVKKYLS